MTLSQIISIIKKIALAQPNIHSCVDEFLDLNDVTAKYSAVILQQQTHRRNNDFIQFNFYLGYSDRLNEDKSNEIEIQSTGIQVINSIIYSLENRGIDCTIDSYNVFQQRFLAEAAGCYTQLTITVPQAECEDDFSKEELDTTITKNGVYNYLPTTGLGFESAKITVNVPSGEIKNQTKEELITINNKRYTYTPDKDYTGIGELNVTVQIPEQPIYEEGYVVGKEDGINEQKRKLTDISITENGNYNREDGFSSVIVNVPVPEINNQEKSITINSNGTSSVVPDAGYTGISKMNITVNVPTSGGDGIDLTSLGYTSQENASINTEIQDTIAYSQSLLENYTNSTSYSNNNRITFVPLFPCSGRTSFYRMFSYCINLTTIPSLDTTSGDNFSGMFDGCSSLKFVPQLDTSKNTDFSYLFSDCKSLTSIPALDTKKGNNFQYMFNNCYMLSSIPYLDTSNTTSNATNFSFMFSGCRSLSTIPEIDVTKGYTFERMFSGCSSLVNIGKLHSKLGSEFSAMFSGCYKLETISLINISDTDDKNNLLQMFEGCSKLKNITFEGSINADISFYYTEILTYNSIKSILTACAATTNTNSKRIEFNQSIADQNNELTNLVTQCTEKGWTIQNLTIQ